MTQKYAYDDARISGSAPKYINELCPEGEVNREAHILPSLLAITQS